MFQAWHDTSRIALWRQVSTFRRYTSGISEIEGAANVLTFNGVRADTGCYVLDPMDEAAFAARLRSRKELVPPEVIAAAKERRKRKLGARYGIDVRDLSKSGWGILFAAREDPAIAEALQPLIDWRRTMAGSRCMVLDGIHGYCGQSKDVFLYEHGGAPGQPVDPKNLPYYLLLVGGPEQIPFEFQQGVDLEHAVGRIAFDSPDAYHAYANAVVAAEQRRVVARQAIFWSPQHDSATRLSSEYLAEPLAARFANRLRIQALTRDGATKDQLRTALHANAPAFLFTGSHGVQFSADDPRLREEQGALLCQDSDGVQHRYFTARDLGTCDLTGMIAFLFACYSGGTPRYDEFAFIGDSPEELAPHPFVARLPQRMLERGAVAVVAHIDRAWSCSMVWHGTSHLETFEDAISQLLDGFPVGAAMEPFNIRSAQLSWDVSRLFESIARNQPVSDEELAMKWTARNDAHFYTVLGDPAARMLALEEAHG